MHHFVLSFDTGTCRRGLVVVDPPGPRNAVSLESIQVISKDVFARVLGRRSRIAREVMVDFFSEVH